MRREVAGHNQAIVPRKTHRRLRRNVNCRLVFVAKLWTHLNVALSIEE